MLKMEEKIIPSSEDNLFITKFTLSLENIISHSFYILLLNYVTALFVHEFSLFDLTVDPMKATLQWRSNNNLITRCCHYNYIIIMAEPRKRDWWYHQSFFVIISRPSLKLILNCIKVSQRWQILFFLPLLQPRKGWSLRIIIIIIIFIVHQIEIKDLILSTIGGILQYKIYWLRHRTTY